MADPQVSAPTKEPPPRPPAPITNPTHENHIWARRSFLGLAGWGLLSGTFGVWATAMLRFMFPRVLFEPPSSFKAGFKTDYSPETVSEKYKDQFRVWIVRDTYNGEDQLF